MKPVHLLWGEHLAAGAKGKGIDLFWGISFLWGVFLFVFSNTASSES